MNLLASQTYTDEIKQIKKPCQIADRHFGKASIDFCLSQLWMIYTCIHRLIFTKVSLCLEATRT